MDLIRTLCALALIVSLLPLFVKAEELICAVKPDHGLINDEICLQQLRELLMISYDLECAGRQLSFRYGGRDFRLSQVNDMLLLQPGTQIYLDDVDELHFEARNGCIYVCYVKKNKRYERALCRKDGIHLDRFSDCFGADDESGDGDG